jgi:curli production assembly/transport component CsgG
MRTLALLLLMMFIAATAATAEDSPSKLIDKYIAVFDLDAVGVSSDLPRPLTDSIRQVLMESNAYELIERSQMNRILAEQKFQLSGCLSGSCTVEAGQILGVGKIVTGSVSRVGQTYYLSLQLLNVGTGKIEKTSEDTCRKCAEDDLIDASKRLARRLLGKDSEGGGKEKKLPDPATVKHEDTSGELSVVLERIPAAIFRGLSSDCKLSFSVDGYLLDDYFYRIESGDQKMTSKMIGKYDIELGSHQVSADLACGKTHETASKNINAAKKSSIKIVHEQSCYTFICKTTLTIE